MFFVHPSQPLMFYTISAQTLTSAKSDSAKSATAKEDTRLCWKPPCALAFPRHRRTGSTCGCGPAPIRSQLLGDRSSSGEPHLSHRTPWPTACVCLPFSTKELRWLSKSGWDAWDLEPHIQTNKIYLYVACIPQRLLQRHPWRHPKTLKTLKTHLRSSKINKNS